MSDEKKQPAPSDFSPEQPSLDAPTPVVGIQFRPGAKIYYFDPNGFTLSPGDHVIMETSRGAEFGICASGNHEVPFREVVPPLRKVLRLANEDDEKTVAQNRQREKKAMDICQQKIQEHHLEMQLVSAEYAFDGSKIIFFFTAEDRVDFRELVKQLAGVFRTRIELRQIGVRDKAKMVGGLGICGRPFCCSQFLDDFQPVSIKMAKTQNLSLNPTKISGTCGRLMCCLKYEQEAYEDLLKNSPKAESFVDTPDGRGTVVDVNLLRSTVKVRMEQQPDTIGCYHNCDICVLRNGKGKKGDAPIPAELAPISGGGKRQPEPEVPEETPMHLDPIRFRYRPDDIVEEAPEGEEPRKKKRPEPSQEPARRERRPRRPRTEDKGHESEQRSRKAPPKQHTERPRLEGKPDGKPEGRPRPEGRPDGKPRNPNRKPPQETRRPRPESKPDGKPEGGEKEQPHRSHRRPYRGHKPQGGNGAPSAPPAQ